MKMSFWSFAVVLLLGIATCVDGKIRVLDGSDPGSCVKRNKGEILIVRDRQNKSKLLICSKSDGIYAWKTLDGSTPSGEFFNPGYDCSSILDNNPKAKDGFYWIKLNLKTPRKVWCDMTTDGGGFMLIGRKNTPKTWAVPSNNKPVEPFGTSHWSSALGDAPVMDFRVQMATANEFGKTKAHWFYSFKGSRKLKNLMVINQGGCSRTSPGIGNVAYVKDLIADRIVTTNFRCSKFGIGHHRSTNFGWSMMNLCLQKPCPWGFAFHRRYRQKHQTDYSGAFSYSVTGRISGIQYPATAFVGCDNGQCCGCYGPVGSKRNYCFEACKAKNGGKITKKVFTWFWVRSSLPKRVWNQCMEYKVREHGVAVWYKLKGGSQIPKKGRCSKDEPLFYDGMIVASNAVTAKKVPSINGMMVYRTDNQKLYVTGNQTWNEVAQQKKVMKLVSIEIAKLEKKVENARLFDLRVISGEYLFFSITLMGKPNYIKQLKQWLPSGTSWQICYRASQDGWRSAYFHQRCDGKGPTVTVIRVGPYIFGGYTDIAWGGSGRYRGSTGSFIFSFRNKYNIKPFKSPVYQNSVYGIYTNNGYGPTFGCGHDIYIANNAHTSTNSYVNFGCTYRLPSSYSYGHSNTRALLAGSYKFRPSEVEVFYKR